VREAAYGDLIGVTLGGHSQAQAPVAGVRADDPGPRGGSPRPVRATHCCAAV
jgi:hypothetical protein